MNFYNTKIRINNSNNKLKYPYCEEVYFSNYSLLNKKQGSPFSNHYFKNNYCLKNSNILERTHEKTRNIFQNKELSLISSTNYSLLGKNPFSKDKFYLANNLHKSRIGCAKILYRSICNVF